jgi:hypothetical protein
MDWDYWSSKLREESKMNVDIIRPGESKKLKDYPPGPGWYLSLGNTIGILVFKANNQHGVEFASSGSVRLYKVEDFNADYTPVKVKSISIELE